MNIVTPMKVVTDKHLSTFNTENRKDFPVIVLEKELVPTNLSYEQVTGEKTY